MPDIHSIRIGSAPSIRRSTEPDSTPSQSDSAVKTQRRQGRVKIDELDLGRKLPRRPARAQNPTAPTLVERDSAPVASPRGSHGGTVAGLRAQKAASRSSLDQAWSELQHGASARPQPPKRDLVAWAAIDRKAKMGAFLRVRNEKSSPTPHAPAGKTPSGSASVGAADYKARMGAFLRKVRSEKPSPTADTPVGKTSAACKAKTGAIVHKFRDAKASAKLPALSPENPLVKDLKTTQVGENRSSTFHHMSEVMNEYTRAVDGTCKTAKERLDKLAFVDSMASTLPDSFKPFAAAIQQVHQLDLELSGKVEPPSIGDAAPRERSPRSIRAAISKRESPMLRHPGLQQVKIDLGLGASAAAMTMRLKSMFDALRGTGTFNELVSTIDGRIKRLRDAHKTLLHFIPGDAGMSRKDFKRLTDDLNRTTHAIGVLVREMERPDGMIQQLREFAVQAQEAPGTAVRALYPTA